MNSNQTQSVKLSPELGSKVIEAHGHLVIEGVAVSKKQLPNFPGDKEPGDLGLEAYLRMVAQTGGRQGHTVANYGGREYVVFVFGTARVEGAEYPIVYSIRPKDSS